MFERLFPRRKPDPKPLPQPTPQLALGALLVRVAFADKSYQVAEVSQIDRILARTFNLKPLEAAKLRATCEALERPYADRKALGDAMWSVALADGGRGESEEIQLLAIETALGLTDQDMAAARETALKAL